MKRILAAISIAVFAVPVFADEAGQRQGPTTAIGSHDVGGTDARHVGGSGAASTASGYAHGSAPGVGPTSSVGSHDVGGTDPRHITGRSGDSAVPGGSRALGAPGTGPTDPIGSLYVGGSGTR